MTAGFLAAIGRMVISFVLVSAFKHNETSRRAWRVLACACAMLASRCRTTPTPHRRGHPQRCPTIGSTPGRRLPPIWVAASARCSDGSARRGCPCIVSSTRNAAASTRDAKSCRPGGKAGVPAGNRANRHTKSDHSRARRSVSGSWISSEERPLEPAAGWVRTPVRNRCD
jgi:hypothetical protein